MSMPKPDEPVTWEFALQYPFPYKVFFIANIDYTKFINWNADGTMINIDMIGLQDYLLSTVSIFKIKTLSIFLEHLEAFQFERVELPSSAAAAVDANVQLIFQHEFFQRDRRDLLKLIQRREPLPRPPRNERPKFSEHMKEDLCFTRQGSLSSLQFRRLTQQVHMKFENETRILREKFREADKRFAKAGLTARPEDNSIPVNEDMYENPQESSSNKYNENPDCAGFFGNATPAQLATFFGEYLPKYEKDANGATKIVVSLPARLNNSKMEYQDSEDVDNDFDNETFNEDDADADADNDDEKDLLNIFDNEIYQDGFNNPFAENDMESRNEHSNAISCSSAAVQQTKSNDGVAGADDVIHKVENIEPEDAQKGFFFQDILKLKPVEMASDEFKQEPKTTTKLQKIEDPIEEPMNIE